MAGLVGILLSAYNSTEMASGQLTDDGYIKLYSENEIHVYFCDRSCDLCILC